jgi:hypothetical protein
MSPVTLSGAGADYLAALERELADLPPDERAELLEEVEASLHAAGEDPVGRLGTPARFAAELRASAGLPPAPAAPAPPRESAWSRLRRDPAFRAALAHARELSPVWWVARAYLLLAALSVVTRQSYAVPFPRLTGARALDVVLVSLAVAASIALGFAGRRRSGRLEALRIAVNLALVACVAFLPAFVDRARGDATSYVYLPAPAVAAGLSEGGRAVTNVYPFDTNGRLLHDVRLYDQDGRALEVGRGANDPHRRPVFGKKGLEIFNAFPIRYYEPGTNRVAHPNATPAGLMPIRLR